MEKSVSPKINVEDIEEFQNSLLKCLPCKAVFLNEKYWNNHQSTVHSKGIY